MSRVQITEVAARAGVGDALYALDGAQVQIDVHGGGPALIYAADVGGSTLPNPLTTDHGRIQGFLEEGTYDLTITFGDEVTPETVRIEAVAAGGAPDPTTGLVRVVAPGSISGVYVLDTVGERETWLIATLAGETTVQVGNLAAGATVRIFTTEDATGGYTLSVSDGVVSTGVPVNGAPTATTSVVVYTPDGEELIITGGGVDRRPKVITANYVFAASDVDRPLEGSSPTPIVWTIPSDGSDDFSDGDVISGTQTGYGQIQFAPASGVTLHSLRKFRGTKGRGAKWELRKRGPNDWELTGALTTTRTFDVLRDVPGLLGYYKGDLMPGADGAAIPTGTDSSGDGYDITNATGAQQPTKHTNVVNGHAVMRFDRAASQRLKHATMPANAVTTAYIVFKERTRLGSGTQVILDRAAIGTGKATISSGASFFPGGAGAGTFPSVPNPPDWCVGVVTWHGEHSSSAVNFDDGAATGDQSATQVGLTIGSQADGSNAFDGDIEEIIICLGDHDDETRRRITEALLAVVGQVNA